MPNAEVALRGYDPLKGNRLLRGESDPGLRHKIFNPSTVIDEKVQFHPSLDMFDSLHCSLSSKMTVVNNYVDYRKQQSGDFKVARNNYSNFDMSIPVLFANIKKAESSSTQSSRRSVSNTEEAFHRNKRCFVY